MSELNKSLQKVNEMFKTADEKKQSPKQAPKPKKESGLVKSLQAVVLKEIQPTKEQMAKSRKYADKPINSPFRTEDGRYAMNVKVNGKVFPVYSEQPLTTQDIKDAQEFILQDEFPQLFKQYQESFNNPDKVAGTRIRQQIMSGTKLGDLTDVGDLNEYEQVKKTLSGIDKAIKQNVVEPLRKAAEDPYISPFITPLVGLNELGKRAEELDTMPNRGIIQALGAGIIDPLSLRRTQESGPLVSTVLDPATNIGGIFAKEATPMERVMGVLSGLGVAVPATSRIMGAARSGPSNLSWLLKNESNLPTTGWLGKLESDTANRVGNFVADTGMFAKTKKIGAEAVLKSGTKSKPIDIVKSVTNNTNPIEMTPEEFVVFKRALDDVRVNAAKQQAVLSRSSNTGNITNVRGLMGREMFDNSLEVYDAFANKFGLPKMSQMVNPVSGVTRVGNISLGDTELQKIIGNIKIKDIPDGVDASKFQQDVLKSRDVVGQNSALDAFNTEVRRSQMSTAQKLGDTASTVFTQMALSDPVGRGQDFLSNMANLLGYIDPIQAGVRKATKSAFGVNERGVMEQLGEALDINPRAAWNSMDRYGTGSKNPATKLVPFMMNLADQPTSNIWRSVAGGEISRDIMATNIAKKNVIDWIRNSDATNGTNFENIVRQKTGLQANQILEDLDSTDFFNSAKSLVPEDVVNSAILKARTNTTVSGIGNQIAPEVSDFVARQQFTNQSALTPFIRGGQEFFGRVPIAGQVLGNTIFRYGNTIYNVTVDAAERTPFGFIKAYGDFKRAAGSPDGITMADINRLGDTLGKATAGTIYGTAGTLLGANLGAQQTPAQSAQILPRVEKFGSSNFQRPELGWLGRLGGPLKPLMTGNLVGQIATSDVIKPEDKKQLAFRTLSSLVDQPLFNSMGNIPKLFGQSSGNTLDKTWSTAQSLFRSNITPGIIRPFNRMEDAIPSSGTTPSIGDKIAAALQLGETSVPDQRAMDELNYTFGEKVTSGYPDWMRSRLGMRPTQIQFTEPVTSPKSGGINYTLPQLLELLRQTNK